MFRKAIIFLIIISQFILYGTALAEDTTTTSEDIFIVPVDGSWEQSSDFGARTMDNGDTRFHPGIDLGADEDTPVLAAADGTVITAGPIDGYGDHVVVISHEAYGLATIYGHMSAMYVYEGMSVAQGDQIGAVGNEGYSFGDHLHFEVRPSLSFWDIDSHGAIDPATYCSALKAGSGIGSGGSGAAWDMTYSMNLDENYDFAAPIREIAEKFSDIATAALGILTSYMNKIFMVLITIDLAIGAMFKTFDTEMDGTGLFKWIVYKFFFYAFLLWLLQNWGSIMNTWGKDLFVSFGGLSMGSTEAAAANAISDPTAIMQKGMHLISPIFTELGKMHGMSSLFNNSLGMIILCTSFGVILFALFAIMGVQIAKAYIEFYLIVLFGFTSLIFAGTKQTRSHAANGLNAIFAASVNLMFFCMFSLLIQTAMQNITMDAVFTKEMPNGKTTEYSTGANIRDVDDFARRTRQVESSGRYDVYNDGGSGAYGAYQQMPEYWDGRCAAYEADHPDAVLSKTADGNSPSNAPNTMYSWNPENQDAVSKYEMQCFYDESGSWRYVAKRWYGEDNSDYWGKICGAKGSSVPTSVLNFIVLFKLILCCLIFIYIGDKLSVHILELLGGKGFHFGQNNQ